MGPQSVFKISSVGSVTRVRGGGGGGNPPSATPPACAILVSHFPSLSLSFPVYTTWTNILGVG